MHSSIQYIRILALTEQLPSSHYRAPAALMGLNCSHTARAFWGSQMRKKTGVWETMAQLRHNQCMDYTDAHTAISGGISGGKEGGVEEFTEKTKKLTPTTGLDRLRRQVMGRRLARL